MKDDIGGRFSATASVPLVVTMICNNPTNQFTTSGTLAANWIRIHFEPSFSPSGSWGLEVV
jgi:hypothetical protein